MHWVGAGGPCTVERIWTCRLTRARARKRKRKRERERERERERARARARERKRKRKRARARARTRTHTHTHTHTHTTLLRTYPPGRVGHFPYQRRCKALLGSASLQCTLGQGVLTALPPCQGYGEVTQK